ncbi:MAG: hypothetical protein ACFUZC_16540 [Chthoniobacteraceae bacterium]
MPTINRSNVEVWKRNFRRKYSGDLPTLRTLADTISAEAGEMVTITQSQFEGGSGTGIVTGNKLEMLAAVEELLAELDATAANAAATPVRVIYPVFAYFPH